MIFDWFRRRRPNLRGLDLPESLAAALSSITNRFRQRGIEHAVIGGVAIALHGPPRTTLDIDFIIDSEAADQAHDVLLALGLELLQRNKVFAGYLIGGLRVDLLFTQGTYTREMLERAVVVETRSGPTRVVRPEDLVGLKLQALANNPAREQDERDIRTLLSTFRDQLDMSLVRQYFVLFEKEAELDAFLQAVRTSGP